MSSKKFNNYHPALRQCWRDIGCELLDVDKEHALHPDTYLVPELALRYRLYPGCRAKLDFRSGPCFERMWVDIIGVFQDALYWGLLRNTPTDAFKRLRIGSSVVFSPSHICAVALLDTHQIGSFADLTEPSGKAARQIGLWNPCAGCAFDAPLCRGCDAIKAIEKMHMHHPVTDAQRDLAIEVPKHVNTPVLGLCSERMPKG